MGLPMLWSTIFGWLKPAKAGVLNVKTEVPNFGRKHKEIPVLKDYKKTREKILESVSVNFSEKMR